MSPRLVPMDKFLLDQLVANERDPLVSEICSGPNFAALALQRPNLSFAMLDGGELVAGGGLVPLWHGRAEAWQLTSRRARPRQLAAAAKFARQVMDARQRDPAFRRIEAFVRADAGWALSFLRALGFVREGLLRAWDPAGRDMWICSRISETAR